MSEELNTGKPRENIEQAQPVNDAAKNKTSEINPPPPAVAPPPKIDPPPSNSHHPQKAERYSVEWWKVRLEIVALIVGIGVAFLMLLQWIEMKKATKATLDSVEVSRSQMTIMQRQIDDSEAQQRAWLRFGEITVVVTTNIYNGDANYRLDVSYTIKNTGFTPAIEMAGYGTSHMEGGIFPVNIMTNGHIRWDQKSIPDPTPFKGGAINGGAGMMPQEIATNGMWSTGQIETRGGMFYCENWISYRDIFLHPFIIGQGWHYDFTNSRVVMEFIYSGQYRQKNQTNSTP